MIWAKQSSVSLSCKAIQAQWKHLRKVTSQDKIQSKQQVNRINRLRGKIVPHAREESLKHLILRNNHNIRISMVKLRWKKEIMNPPCKWLVYLKLCKMLSKCFLKRSTIKARINVTTSKSVYPIITAERRKYSNSRNEAVSSALSNQALLSQQVWKVVEFSCSTNSNPKESEMLKIVQLQDQIVLDQEPQTISQTTTG